VRPCRTRILIISCLLLAGAPGRAQTRDHTVEEASRHFEAGDKLQDEGNYAAAAREYERAYQLAPHPRPLFNIAKLHELQGQRADALEWYRRYLRESRDGKDDEAYRKRAAMRVRFLESTPARLKVACDLEEPTQFDLDSARVIITTDDGQVKEARCDEVTDLRAGHYRVTVRAPNYETSRIEDLPAKIGEPYTYVFPLRRKKGQVRVFADPDDALVLADGNIRIDPAGVPSALPAGIHTLRVEAPGRVTDERSLEVRSDRETRVNVPLRRKPRSGQNDLAVFNAFYGGFVVPAAVRALCIGCGANKTLEPETGLALAVGGAGLGAFTSFFLTDDKMTTGTAYFIMAGPLWGSFEGFGIAEAAAGTSREATLAWTLGGGLVGASIAVVAAKPVDSTIGDALLLHTGAFWGTLSGFMLWGSIEARQETDLGRFILAGLNVGLVGGLAFSGETEYSWSHVAMINLGTAASTAVFLGLGAASETDSAGTQTRRWRFALGGMAIGLVASGLLTRNWDEPRYFKTLARATPNLALLPPLPRVEVASDGSRRYLLDLLSGSW